MGDLRVPTHTLILILLSISYIFPNYNSLWIIANGFLILGVAA